MKLVTPLTVISVLVRDQDEALKFYTEKLGLEKRIDITYGPGLRLLTVASKGQQRPQLALAQPDIALHGEEHVNELIASMRQEVSWIFDTKNCDETYKILLSRGVKFVSAPTRQLYGVEAIFEDPYGNTFSLLEAVPEAGALFIGLRIGAAA